MPTVTVNDPYGVPPEATEAPRYDIEKALQLLRASQPGPAPVQQAPGFLDRLAAGLANMQVPQGGGGGFGANFLASAGRSFGRNRLANRDADLKRQVDEYEQGNALKAAEARVQLGGLEKDYESRRTSSSESARALANWKKEKREYEAKQAENTAQDAKDAAKELRRTSESDRDYGLRLRAENRQAAKDRADAVTGGGKPPTDAQTRAAVFAERGRKAISTPEFAGLEDRIINGGQSALLGLSAPRMAQNNDQKNYRQAVESFALAFLREESMASIKDEEFAQVFRTFFAQPGENAETIQGKRLAREAALTGQEQKGAAAGSRPTPPIPATWKKVQ